MYKQITKRDAFKRWEKGETVYLLSCNLRPSMMWTPCPVSKEHYVKSVNTYRDLGEKYPQKDEENSWVYSNERELNQMAWDLMYGNWEYYNANNEMGYYAHYYIEA